MDELVIGREDATIFSGLWHHADQIIPNGNFFENRARFPSGHLLEVNEGLVIESDFLYRVFLVSKTSL
jgi:hypothetical protein